MKTKFVYALMSLFIFYSCSQVGKVNTRGDYKNMKFIKRGLGIKTENDKKEARVKHRAIMKAYGYPRQELVFTNPPQKDVPNEIDKLLENIYVETENREPITAKRHIELYLTKRSTNNNPVQSGEEEKSDDKNKTPIQDAQPIDYPRPHGEVYLERDRNHKTKDNYTSLVELTNQVENSVLLLRHIAPNLKDLMNIFHNQIPFKNVGIEITDGIKDDLNKAKEIIIKSLKSQAEESELEILKTMEQELNGILQEEETENKNDTKEKKVPAYEDFSNNKELKEFLNEIYISFADFFDFIQGNETKKTDRLKDKINKILNAINNNTNLLKSFSGIQIILNGAKNRLETMLDEIPQEKSTGYSYNQTY